MKLNQIVAAAVVAAASVPAMASIGLPLTGNGELFLVVWDQVDAVSYTKDLGINMDDFFATSSTERSFALDDAFFTSFLGVAATTASDLKFAVIAADGIGTKRLFTTITQEVTAFNNGNLNTATANVETFAGNQVTVSANTTHVGAVAINGTSYDVAPNGAYFGGSNRPTFNVAGLPWSNSVLVGTSSAFRSFSSQGVSGGTPTPQSTFEGLWSVTNVGGAYTASYSVAAVPEADGIAMALAGFGALGFLARRRRAN